MPWRHRPATMDSRETEGKTNTGDKTKPTKTRSGSSFCGQQLLWRQSKNRTIKIEGMKQKPETGGGSKTTLARCDLGTRSGRKRNEQEGASAPVLKKNDARGKTDRTTAQSKAYIFFIEIQQDYTESTEVTALPPSFFIGIKN
jgi:hypothetical protein